MNRRFTSLAITLGFVVIAILGWSQRNALFDAWRLRGYEPPAEIVQIADETTMTDNARRLFYVYRPELNDKTQFNSNCSGSEQTIVLGCYIKHQGIYLYDVNDPRLDGVIEVTAAHELLHAEYDRLSSKERARVDALTQQVAGTITDERFLQTVENYRQKDPNVVPNELHSILATEVRNLPSELERHYAQFFSNRSAIVDMAEKYKQAFSEREAEVRDIDTKLVTLKSEIETLNSSLETQQASLKNQYDNLQSQKAAGNTEGYNQGVPTYNQSVNEYNASVRRQKSLVTQYNELVERRNSIATEENELINALDSRETIEIQ
jgi:hypothetical protein